MPSKAILFYTREEFIYGQLNKALRTTKIHHVLPFRFIFQDICNQMNELNAQYDDNQTLVVYRGQVANPYEIADLFLAYCMKSSIMTTMFFSTSKNEKASRLFIPNQIGEPFSTEPPAILFKITARKQDISPYFPFADISKVSSMHDEEEVLEVRY
ncbi:unnamed protein product [Rotaria sp. Silwood1]|nr:unnamed protein product [Rotaria sp. Silwood1]CAF5136002.1 unnamed protein product [Rotaria sp. Silwood1]